MARDWRPIFLESSEGNDPTGDVGGMARTIRSFWFLNLPAPSSCVALQRIAQKPPIDIMLLCYVLLNSFNAIGTHLVCSTDIRSNGGNRRSTSSITARATEAAMKRSPSISGSRQFYYVLLYCLPLLAPKQPPTFTLPVVGCPRSILTTNTGFHPVAPNQPQTSLHNLVPFVDVESSTSWMVMALYSAARPVSPLSPSLSLFGKKAYPLEDCTFFSTTTCKPELLSCYRSVLRTYKFIIHLSSLEGLAR